MWNLISNIQMNIKKYTGFKMKRITKAKMAKLRETLFFNAIEDYGHSLILANE
jgi:hypothetical protein